MEANYFAILYWFRHTSTWICHECTCVPHLESPSHLPHRIISLDHPHAPAPSILYPVSNIDGHFVSYMIVYMFQCHSPKSSHPLPLPQSPKVRSIHLCLFCCLASRVIITIFLNSVYMCQYTVLVFFFLAYFTLYNLFIFYGHTYMSLVAILYYLYRPPIPLSYCWCIGWKWLIFHRVLHRIQ